MAICPQTTLKTLISTACYNLVLQFFFGGIFVGTLVASDLESTTGTPTIQKKGTHTITPFQLNCTYRLPAKLSRGGEISAASFGAGTAWTHVSGGESLITMASFDYRHTDYHWGKTDFEPFNHVNSYEIFLWQEWVFNPKAGRSLAGFSSGATATANSAAPATGTRCSFGIGVKQYFSRKESAWLGIITGYSRHRERWMVLPMIFVDWLPAKNLNFRVGNGVSATWDIGGKNEFLLGLGVRYNATPIATGKGKVWYSQNVPATVSATWNATKNIFIRAGVNTILWSEYRAWQNGKKRAGTRFTADPTVEFSLQAGIRF